MSGGYPRYPNDGPYSSNNDPYNRTGTPSSRNNGHGPQQPQQQYAHGQQRPYAPLDMAAASSYSVNAPSVYAPGHEQMVSGGGDGGGYDMYDDGERSPLTANAQPLAGTGYPPSMMGASTASLHHQNSMNGSNHGGQYQNIHPGASTPGFLKHDPYGYSGNDNGYDNLAPHVGFTRPSYPGRHDTADSEADWQKRARMPTRGKTTKVKLTKQGNFVHEYPVPNPIINSVEAKWRAMCECGKELFFETRLAGLAGRNSICSELISRNTFFCFAQPSQQSLRT